MKRILLTLIAILSLNFWCMAQVEVKGLLCENRQDPVGLDNSQPQFSWQLFSNRRNVMQTAYEIKVALNISDLKKENKLVWNSGKVISDQSVHVTYNGNALQSGKKYFWQVRVWDNKNKASGWSNVASWQMGLLKADDWKATWIKAGYPEKDNMQPSPLFRKEFNAGKKIQSATAYITSHGLYEAFLNGKRIGDAFLTPGFTSYNKRLQYQVYDVTSLLQNGNNAIGVALGNGWYRGNIGWGNNKFGKELALLFQLAVTYTDGTSDLIVSDGNWKSSTGAILNSEIYNGETFDARLDKTGWVKVGYDDKDWNGVIPLDVDNKVLIATYNEPVRKHETFKPVKIFKTPAGEDVIDFGQNLVGFVQVKAKGNAGDKIILSHAEVLDKEGNFYTTNLRSAKQQDTYILKGEGEETFAPHFTFQGFRYVKVEGYPGELNPENFTAVALYSDMKATGSFSCSNPLVNQLQHNIQWGQRGNFLDVPTDCPQRDERLGWTGDAQVFSRTAAFNMQVNNFFGKWLKDVAADQCSDGRIPHVIPNVLGPNDGGSAGWADVCTIIPWNMYQIYGDKRLLEDQYPSMKAWVTYMEKSSKNDLWNTGFHFGDWLFYRPDDDNDGRAALTDKYLIAQCFYANSTQLLINAAKVLDKSDDVEKYTALLQRIKAAFLKEYVTLNGRLVSSSQTAYVLALNFDMLPESLRAQAAERLVNNIHDYGDHLTTGFLGTPYLCFVLSRFGYTDVAYKLLLQKTYPSWLYPVTMGATTIWERWDGQKPDGTFENPGMNSFNHYAYGAIGDWMYRVIAGIELDEAIPGYKQVKIMPHIGGDLNYAKADLQTYYGLVSSSWKNENGQLQFDIEIPANSKAAIYIPADNAAAIKESGVELSKNNNIRVVGKEGNYIKVETGSGKYHFTIKK